MTYFDNKKESTNTKIIATKKDIIEELDIIKSLNQPNQKLPINLNDRINNTIFTLSAYNQLELNTLEIPNDAKKILIMYSYHRAIAINRLLGSKLPTLNIIYNMISEGIKFCPYLEEKIYAEEENGNSTSQLKYN